MKDRKPSPKKKYTSPRLTKYGDFKKMTLGIRQTRRESMIAGPSKTRVSMTS